MCPHGSLCFYISCNVSFLTGSVKTFTRFGMHFIVTIRTVSFYSIGMRAFPSCEEKDNEKSRVCALLFMEPVIRA